MSSILVKRTDNRYSKKENDDQDNIVVKTIGGKYSKKENDDQDNIVVKTIGGKYSKKENDDQDNIVVKRTDNRYSKKEIVIIQDSVNKPELSINDNKSIDVIINNPNISPDTIERVKEYKIDPNTRNKIMSEPRINSFNKEKNKQKKVKNKNKNNIINKDKLESDMDRYKGGFVYSDYTIPPDSIYY